MRPSNKSRSRNKNNNNRRQSPNTNAVNRVFDSSGPTGKVRGTPQQIVEKYEVLTADASLAGDRVAAENYQQHSEHYMRMLTAALKEQAERQAEQAARQAEHQKQQAAQQQQARQKREAEDNARNAESAADDQPPMAAVETESENSLVETPENTAPSKPKRRSRTKQAAPNPDNSADASAAE